ncbi:Heat shock protein HslJ [compost metagenome]
MACSDPQLNQWDWLIGDVLGKGAKVTLSAQKLTLSGSGHVLVYTQRDWVQ